MKDTMVCMGQPIGLVCSKCQKTYAANQAVNLCECGGPLLVRYDLTAVKASWQKDQLSASVHSMWRYAPVLPADEPEAVTLSEGWTPLSQTKALGRALGATDLWVKDEGRNPTDSFKARGLSCAVTMAKKLGLRKLAIPSAGNAVDGLISDCGRIVGERKAAEGWFEVSTLKEPYRIEGKKTMGYEVAEQFGWEVPDVILYPCGGGVGLIGMWKAFAELEEMGWIGKKRPKMIAVQATGCEPITRAFRENAAASQFFDGAHTVASGLRVPKALGDFLVLEAVRESGGTAISISDEEMLDAGVMLAECEGIFAAPEGGACVAAVKQLLQTGFLKSGERIVIYNTGSGLKYLEAYATRFPRYAATQQDRLGGLITPR